LEAASAIEAISEALRINEVLTHLDLSHCQLDALDCEGIAEGLHKNHTLLGLHVEGNQAWVDARGFIVPILPIQHGQDASAGGDEDDNADEDDDDDDGAGDDGAGTVSATSFTSCDSTASTASTTTMHSRRSISTVGMATIRAPGFGDSGLGFAPFFAEGSSGYKDKGSSGYSSSGYKDKTRVIGLRDSGGALGGHGHVQRYRRGQKGKKTKRQQRCGGRVTGQSNCWLCERWREHRFVFRPGRSEGTAENEGKTKTVKGSAGIKEEGGAGEVKAKVKLLSSVCIPRTVKLRCDFNRWAEEPMARKMGADEYRWEVVMMVPPGRVHYCFVVDYGDCDVSTAGGPEKTAGVGSGAGSDGVAALTSLIDRPSKVCIYARDHAHVRSPKHANYPSEIVRLVAVAEAEASRAVGAAEEGGNNEEDQEARGQREKIISMAMPLPERVNEKYVDPHDPSHSIKIRPRCLEDLVEDFSEEEQEEEEDEEEDEEEEEEWELGNSIFAPYRLDTVDLMDKAFIADYEQTTIPASKAVRDLDENNPASNIELLVSPKST
jgi:hypothetical protein